MLENESIYKREERYMYMILIACRTYINVLLELE